MTADPLNYTGIFCTVSFSIVITRWYSPTKPGTHSMCKTQTGPSCDSIV